jgi:hypothetical protein
MPKGFDKEKWRFDIPNIGKPSQYFLPPTVIQDLPLNGIFQRKVNKIA